MYIIGVCLCCEGYVLNIHFRVGTFLSVEVISDGLGLVLGQGEEEPLGEVRYGLV